MTQFELFGVSVPRLAALMLLAVGGMFFFSGCEASRPARVLNLDPALTASESVETRDRPIETGDMLIIEVFGEPELTVRRRVEAGGTINYPHFNDLQVGGKTTAEVDGMLTELLGKDFLVSPKVTVQIDKYKVRTVSVFGAVFRQGPVLLPEEQAMDIIEGIASAGGFTQLANPNKILFTRKGVVTTFRYRDLTRSERKVWLEPGDVIEVKERIF